MYYKDRITVNRNRGLDPILNLDVPTVQNSKLARGVTCKRFEGNVYEMASPRGSNLGFHRRRCGRAEKKYSNLALDMSVEYIIEGRY